MLHEMLLILLIGIAFATESSASFCGKLGSYDALCVKYDAVFLLSASPCLHKPKLEQISLTIVNTKGTMRKYTIITTEDISKPRHFGNKDVGFMLEMHPHFYAGGSKYGDLHVTLAVGNFKDNGVHSRKTVLDVKFYMERQGSCSDFSGASFYPAPDCRIAQRTGNFSTLCISKKSVSADRNTEGIFILALDPCSIPFSYRVFAFLPSKNIEVVKKYTGSKTDTRVPVENSKCGFKTVARPDLKKYPISLHYGCSDSSAVQLINDYYFPEGGEVCRPLEGCGRHLKVGVAMRMEGQPNTLNLTFSQDKRMADFNFKMKKQTFTKYKMPEVVNGFIPEVGGHVGILVERLDDLDHGIAEHHVQDVSKEHLAYVLLERHWGEDNETFHFVSPLVHAEFSIPPCGFKHKGSSSLSVGVKVIISISVIAVIAALIFLIYYRWRVGRNRLDGLPYQIELNYDELDKETL